MTVQTRENPKVERTGALPLSGIRILDFGQVIVSPFATRWLALMGAEVILIESSRRPVQRVTPPFAFGRPGPNTGARFNTLNNNKLSCTLNLKTPEAVAIVKKLAAVSQIVTENFSSGTMEKLGLAYDDLRQVNPELIYLSATAFGHTGEWRGYAGFHSTVNALSGLAQITGYPGGAQRLLGAVLPDTIGGIYITYALLTALYAQRQSGRGCYIDFSMLEGLMTIMPEAIIDYTLNGRKRTRIGNRDESKSPHGIYRCKGDDAWVAISVQSQAEWETFCDTTRHAEWKNDPRFANELDRLTRNDELDQLIETWTKQRTANEITELLQTASIASGPALNIGQILEDDHLQQRGFIIEVDHPEAGPRKTAGLPWLNDNVPEREYRRAPLLGEHNDYVFAELLGLSSDEVAELKKTGAIE
jgi:crotonobetainyl-CoA:carnitine CoA-transferase CaiB-like acyl-CoA transferase